jgi:hypothetical protein
VVSVDGADVNVTASLEHEGQRSVACPAGLLGAVVVECWNRSMRVFSHDCIAAPATPVENVTTVQQPVEQGSSTIFLISSAGFAVGDIIRISGCGYSETRTIVGIGSVHLDSPLEYSYPEGASVQKEPAPDVHSADPETKMIAVETVTTVLAVLAGTLVLLVCCCAILLVSWRSALRRLRSSARAAERRIKELEASLEKQHAPVAHGHPGQPMLEEPAAQDQSSESSPKDLAAVQPDQSGQVLHPGLETDDDYSSPQEPQEPAHLSPISRDFLDLALETDDDGSKSTLDLELPEKISIL